MLDGKDTHGMNTIQVNKAGIARTFQNIRLFDKLTVEDNVKIGLHNQVPLRHVAGGVPSAQVLEPGEAGPPACPGSAEHF